jgi:hypothetical protein
VITGWLIIQRLPNADCRFFGPYDTYQEAFDDASDEYPYNIQFLVKP